jgi:lipopolysaccharide cholinephosphotransferase
MKLATPQEITKEQLTKLQNTELQILKDTIGAIEKMGLTYFAVAGTALGAVKYQGFIPWDDDIDIAMPRPDYDKFLQNGQSFLGNAYFLQSFLSEKDFPLAIAKVRLNNTSYIEYSMQKFHINNGIFIDVFPIDGYDSAIFKREQSKIRFYSRKTSLDLVTFGEANGPLVKVKKFIIKMIPPYGSANSLVKRIDELNASVPFESSDEVYCRLVVCKKSLFGKGMLANFCGLKLRIPERAEAYLNLHYGDIRLDVPEDKQVSHHYFTKISFGDSQIDPGAGRPT